MDSRCRRSTSLLAGCGGWRAFRARPGSRRGHARRNGPGKPARHAAPGRFFAKARKLARRMQHSPDPAPSLRPAASRKSLVAYLWQRTPIIAQPNDRDDPAAESGHSSQSVPLHAPCDGSARVGGPPFRATAPRRSVAQARSKGRLSGPVPASISSSRAGTGPESRPGPPPNERMRGEQHETAKNREIKVSPSDARHGAGGQPERAALMRALTAPMSVRPAALAFTAAMTLPMSLTDAAPVAAMASWMITSTSAAESWVGR